MVIQKSLQNTLWIPYVLRNPDQLDDIFLPMLVKLQQLRGKGLAQPVGWGSAPSPGEAAEALGDLPSPRMLVPPLLPGTEPGAVGQWAGLSLLPLSFPAILERRQ